MQTYTLQCSQRFPLALEETFEFFKDPGNLSRITPPWLNFTNRSPNVEMRKGAEIRYVIRWLGLPMNWRTLIAEYEPPFHFVDIQLKGPYRLWEHRHEFRPSDEGTIVTDTVRYALPFGPLGRIAHAALVRRQLNGIFRFRRQVLAGILGAEQSVPPPPEIHPA